MGRPPKHIILGYAAGERPVRLDIQTFLETRALIQANSGGGKSWLTRVLIEQLYDYVQVIVIDPEGEFPSLREKFKDIALLSATGEGEGPISLESAGLLAERLLEHRISAVCDLYELPADKRPVWVKNFITAIMNAPKKFRHRVLIVIDEAQLFVPEGGKVESFNAVVDLCARGRKRGLCAVLAAQRLADVSKKATSQLINRLVGPTTEDVDIDRALDVMSVSRAEREGFKKLLKEIEPGNFFVLGRAISKERLLFKVRNVLTKHPKLGDASVWKPPTLPADRRKALLSKLADLPKAAAARAKNEADLREEVRALRAQLAQEAARHKVATPSAAPAPSTKQVEVVKEVLSVKTVPMKALRAGMMPRLAELSASLKKDAALLEKATDSLAAAAALLADNERTLLAAAGGIEKSKIARPPITGFPPPPKAAPKAPPAPKVPHVAPPRPAPAGESNGDGSVTDKAQKKILRVLYQYPDGCDRGKLALLAGYRYSGGFRNSLSALRSKGLMTGSNDSVMQITASGLNVIDDSFEPLPSGDELLKYWLNHPSFGSAERKVLATLVDQGPLTGQELAEASGYGYSGGFRNALSSLRTAGVIVGKNQETIRLCEELQGVVAAAR